MKRRNLIMHCSLFAGIVSVLAGGDACAAVRIGNATRGNYYNQQLVEQQRAAQVASVNDIARMSGSATNQPESTPESTPESDEQLDACSAIYPNGEFQIAYPTAGVQTGGDKTCVAVVELRGYQMGAGGKDVVLARANVAAGAVVKCNISDFPESSYTADVQNVIFPADSEPTIEDVKKVMNQEQKQNAGLKIAASTLVGALGGNIAGENDFGNDSIMGTDKGKLKDTLIGALGGAAVGVGSTYGGYTGGNMIMSAGINAAAGGVIGNIMAAGDDDLLRIEKCGDTECLWGYWVKGNTLDTEKYTYYIDLDNPDVVMRCNTDNTVCQSEVNLISIKIGNQELNSMKRSDLDKLKGDSNNVYHITEGENNTKTMTQGLAGFDGHTFAKISDAKVATGPSTPALVEFNEKEGFFGKNKDYWKKWKGKTNNATIYYRKADGSKGGEIGGETNLEDFHPMYVSKEDGGIIDFGNKARLKSTLVGAGAGGAIGAFAAYQGAQNDIEERWVSAVREYKDSLQKFFCFTGGRFLSFYNDTVVIPNVSQ